MKTNVLQFGRAAVLTNVFGILFSGLIFPVLAAVLHPQPPWQNPQLFIQSFHWLQTATFFCGYFLITGSLLTFVTLYFLAEKECKIWALSGLALNVIFSVVVFLNYIIQTTYVPYLVQNHSSEADFILAAFSMANPGSFAWALEMWGWGGIGLSFIFMAFIFKNQKREQTLRRLFFINGVCSIASAILTSINMNWIFSPAGFAALIIWNLLVLVIDIILLDYFKNLQLISSVA